MMEKDSSMTSDSMNVVVDEMSAKEILNGYKENLDKVNKLQEDSKNDPENEPYLSKYKAKEILCSMKESVLKYSPEKLLVGHRYEALLGAILMQIGVIDLETEELTSSDNILTEAAKILSPHSTEPVVVIPLINVYNNLGILWCNREDPEKAKTYLLKARETYQAFKCTLLMPLPIDYILANTEEAKNTDFMILEKAHTLTLYYLAQVYGTLKDNLKSGVYCHATLRRQLQYQDLDPIDWSLNSATLSQFFAEQNGFYQSRHHLAASSTILDQYGATLQGAENNDEEQLAKLEIFNHRSADVARCWAKYCILLMSASKNRLMSDSEGLTEAITDMSNLTLEDNENICGGDMRSLVFSDLDVSTYESKVTDKFLLMYQDAREVFLCCQTWLNKAKEYYKLETLASDYIELIQDSSQSYRYLCFFEEDDERRAKMHKRRIDMLEELVKEINPTYYLQLCRQLWFELGDCYSDILNIKLEKMTKEKPTPHALKKINALCEKSIEHYDNFLNSVKNKNGKMPAKFEIDEIRPVISAYSFIGRNSMKRIALDKNIQLQHVMKSFESYQTVVAICKNDPNAAAMMREEYSLCQEMVNILPLKIKKLQAELLAG